MFENIRADMVEALRRRNIHYLNEALYFLLMESHGPQAVVIYRFGRWLANKRRYSFSWFITSPLYPSYWLLSMCIRKAYGIDLDQSADIAPGFCITHFGGIEVRNCRVGRDCNIHQQVKLGLKNTEDNCQAKIGDSVYIGAHARINANISIGNGVTIGAGAFVTEDIPDHSLVLGNPARIAKRGYDNSALL
jgi:serine O-acetyltransferase